MYGFLLQKFCAGQMQDPETLLGCLDDNYDESSKKCQKALDADEEEDNEGMYLPLYLTYKAPDYQVNHLSHI